MKTAKIAVALGLVLVANNVLAGDVILGVGATSAGTASNVVIGDAAVNAAPSGNNVLIGQGSQLGNFAGGIGNTTVGSQTLGGGGQYNTVIGSYSSIGLAANVMYGTIIGSSAQILQGAGGVATNNAVAIGYASIATTSNTVSFGVAAGLPGYPAGFYRTLTNISAGVLANDAVNVSQMNAAIAASGGTDATARASAATAQTTANTAVTNAATAQTTANTALVTANTANTNATTALTTANTANANAATALSEIGGFNTRIGGLETRMDAVETGVAASMAMSGASSNAVSSAYKSAKGMGFGIGYGGFNGKSATAISYAANLRFATVTASASITGNPSVQIGAGFSF